MQLPKPEDAFVNPVKFWSDAVNAQIEFARQSVHFAMSINPVFQEPVMPKASRPKAVRRKTTAVAVSNGDVVDIPKPKAKRPKSPAAKKAVAQAKIAASRLPEAQDASSVSQEGATPAKVKNATRRDVHPKTPKAAPSKPEAPDPEMALPEAPKTS